MILWEQKITPEVRTALEKLCEPHSESCPPDRPYPSTELYMLFQHRICPAFGNSIFSLPYDFVISVRERVIPSLPEDQQKDVLAIGTAMQPFVAEDLEFIRKMYHW